MRTIAAVSIATLALAVLACDGDNRPTSPNGTGRLEVRLTDAPIDEVAEVNVFVTGLTVKRTGFPVERIATGIGLVDLLTLQGTTLELVNLGVAAGDYEFVQIELDQEQSHLVLLDGGEIVPIRIASEEIKVLGGFNVPVGGDVVVVLDFDAGASLRKLGNGDWLMTPIVTQLSPPPAP